MVNCLRYTRVPVDYYSRLVYAGLLVDGYRLSNTPSCRCIVTRPPTYLQTVYHPPVYN